VVGRIWRAGKGALGLCIGDGRFKNCKFMKIKGTRSELFLEMHESMTLSVGLKRCLSNLLMNREMESYYFSA
jgi:hypothetical protein